MPAVRRGRPDRELFEMTAPRDLENVGKPDRVRSRIVARDEDETTLLRGLRVRRSGPPADDREHSREQRVSFILDRFKKFQIVGRRLSNKSLQHEFERSLTKRAASGTINGRDFVPSRKHSQEHFSTDSTARKPKLRGPSRAVVPESGLGQPSRGCCALPAGRIPWPGKRPGFARMARCRMMAPPYEPTVTCTRRRVARKRRS